MKYLDEFSDPELAGKLLDQIRALATRRWAIMEVCGGQTHSIIRHGIDQLLPQQIEMIHGPDARSVSPRSRSSTKLSKSRQDPMSFSAPSGTCCEFRGVRRICSASRAPAVTCGWCTHRWMH